jgi:hypothetical protein
MRLADFEAMVRRMTGDVPAEFLEGVAEIVVSPRVRPHPERTDIFTLGECIPLPAGPEGDPRDIQSRIVLYHGSFAALAEISDGFDWPEEAWETLTHELRHHLEWRARAPDLEAFDAAVEHNFARHDGEPFDPAFYLDGVPVGDDVYQVEDDVFVDRIVARGTVPAAARLDWRGRSYRVIVPEGVSLPAFLAVEGIEDPPAGELVLVLRRRPSVLQLLRRAPVFEGTVRAEPLPERSA